MDHVLVTSIKEVIIMNKIYILKAEDQNFASNVDYQKIRIVEADRNTKI